MAEMKLHAYLKCSLSTDHIINLHIPKTKSPRRLGWLVYSCYLSKFFKFSRLTLWEPYYDYVKCSTGLRYNDYHPGVNDNFIS